MRNADMKIDELLKIQALGNFLQYYHADLTYIFSFRRLKDNENWTLRRWYLSRSPGSFQSFLNEHKVARAVKKGEVASLLGLTMDWVVSDKADKVDEFAIALREEDITQEGKTMTSIASNILFLNNPAEIIPCDTLNRKAVGAKNNKYHDFYSLLLDIIKKNSSLIDESLESVETHISIIETESKEINHLNTIRRNRYIDKLLWCHGLKLKQVAPRWDA